MTLLLFSLDYLLPRQIRFKLLSLSLTREQRLHFIRIVNHLFRRFLRDSSCIYFCAATIFSYAISTGKCGVSFFRTIEQSNNNSFCAVVSRFLTLSHIYFLISRVTLLPHLPSLFFFNQKSFCSVQPYVYRCTHGRCRTHPEAPADVSSFSRKNWGSA